MDFEPVINRIDDGAVHRDGAILAGFALLQLQAITGPHMLDLSDSEGKDFIGAVGGVDAEGEQAHIALVLGIELPNTFDRL